MIYERILRMLHLTRKPEAGDYVILLKPQEHPNHPGVLRGDLGKVIDAHWSKDNELLVDVLSELGYANLNISPYDLKGIKEEDILSGKLPRIANIERVLRQYEALKLRSFYKN